MELVRGEDPPKPQRFRKCGTNHYVQQPIILKELYNRDINLTSEYKRSKTRYGQNDNTVEMYLRIYPLNNY